MSASNRFGFLWELKCPSRVSEQNVHLSHTRTTLCEGTDTVGVRCRRGTKLGTTRHEFGAAPTAHCTGTCSSCWHKCCQDDVWKHSSGMHRLYLATMQALPYSSSCAWNALPSRSSGICSKSGFLILSHRFSTRGEKKNLHSIAILDQLAFKRSIQYCIVYYKCKVIHYGKGNSTKIGHMDEWANWLKK